MFTHRIRTLKFVFENKVSITLEHFLMKWKLIIFLNVNNDRSAKTVLGPVIPL